ncbi:MAG: hypothetical protein M3383_05880 [Actinomycetota bacterium]|nr:hypothetical protein [Actinomycetota bacterium]
MLRDGPIPISLHGAIEYAAGILFIVAPLLLDYDSGTATGVSVAVGVLILIIAATSAMPTGLIPRITLSVHVTLDFVLAVFLIAAPFVLSFSDEGAPTAVFVALGIAHLLITIGTRFKSSQDAGTAA